MGHGQEIEPGLQDVIAASNRLRHELYPVVPRRSDSLSDQLERDVWLIPESLQRTGSFKFRGALNRMMLHACRGGRPVVTASSGNHAIGMTVAAGIVGVESTVVVPTGASEAKLKTLRSLGANVLEMGDGFDEAEDCMYAYAEKNALEIVNSFDADVIAGHGTAALDAIRQVPDLDVLLAPVASGGLLAGSAVVMKAVSPNSTVLGVQTTAWPAMYESLHAGKIVDVSGSDTVADGLAGNATRSKLPFQMIRRDVAAIHLVDEDSILNGVRHGMIAERLVLEGAGAATLAAVLAGAEIPGTGPVGLILSGSNSTEDVLTRALAM